jgi:D-alanyl-D-alanine carboxypeptidase
VAAPVGVGHTGVMRTLRALPVLLGVLLAGCSPDGRSATPDPPETSHGFDSAVAALEERVEVYGEVTTGVVALVRVGERTHLVTAGRARRRPRVAMEADMRFPLASITKSMTATAIMQLVEDGRLALDDPVDRWLPELRAVAQAITIEHLLAHQSGLDHATEREMRELGTDSSRLLEAVASRPLKFEPGTRSSYSNEGYVALGLVAERIVGQSFGEVLKSGVFAPAGMGSSSLSGRSDVHGYDGREDVSDQFFLRWIPPAGSVVATAEDVDAFYRALWAGQLVDPDAVEQMRTLRGHVGAWSDYGFGLARERFSCGTAMGHGGRIHGISTEAWTLDDEDRSAVVLVNDQLSDVAPILVDAALCG